MGLFDIIIAFILIFLVIVTFIREPGISMQYGKECVKSIVLMVKWCVRQVANATQEIAAKNETLNITGMAGG